MDVFLQKMGMRVVVFSWKIGKNGMLLTFLVYNLVKFWQSWSFFGQIWVRQQVVFHDKFEKKLYESTVCFRELRFFDKIWTWEQFVFRGLAFCWQNMGIRAVIFSREIGEKVYSIEFWTIYSIFLTGFTFFGPNMGIAVGCFSWKVWKKRHKSTLFLREWTLLLQNMGMRAVWFLENGRFSQNMDIRAVIF